MSDLKLPKGQFIGFGRDGKFLALPESMPAQSTADIRRFNLAIGTTVEATDKIEFARKATINGYISPNGDKIVWLLMRGRRELRFQDELPFVTLKNADVREFWISDDCGRGIRELGELTDSENVVPKWLPDEKGFSLLVSNHMRIVAVE